MKNATTVSRQTRIDLPESVRVEVCDILNITLATFFHFYSQAKQAHWNVKGMNFFSLHGLFDDIAEYANDAIDIVAERITSLGVDANGTLRQAQEKTLLTEYDLNARSGEAHVKALSKQVALLCQHCRESIEISDTLSDADTADLYTGLSRELDKKLWMLEAHLAD